MPLYEKPGVEEVWEITKSSHKVESRFARIADGNFVVRADGKNEWNREKVQAAYDERIAAKLADGWVIAAEAAASPRNAELEAAIEAAPERDEAFLVYGDWLQSQGDPRGELVALQAKGAHVVAAPPKNATEALDQLRRKTEVSAESVEHIERQSRLLTQHRAHFFGSLPPDPDVLRIRWRLGFFDRVRIAASEEQNLSAFWPAFAALDSARFYRALTIGPAILDDELRYDDALDAMLETGLPKTLTELYIGDFKMEESEISWAHMGEVSKIYPLLTRLRSLRLRAGSFELGAIDLPELRSFAIETGGLTRANLHAINEGNWPNLAALEIYFGSENYDADCSVADLLPILERGAFPKVTSLGLVNHEFSDDLAKAIVKAPIVKQLTSLDLSKGVMTEVGARTILASAEAFMHLKVLDVSENYINDATEEELKNAFGERLIGGQRGDETEEYRYAVVGE